MKIFLAGFSKIPQLPPRHAKPTMKHITLTPAVSIATHSRLRALAKSNKIPLRALCSLLIERAISDVESGKLAIRPPTLTTAKP